MGRRKKTSYLHEQNSALECLVCGDQATGINFNAASCVSCKAFFRRHGSKEENLKCIISNQCRIDRVTRKFCSKCRLDKCLAVGMKKELIRTWAMKKPNMKQPKTHKSNDIPKEQKAQASASTESNLSLECVSHTTRSPSGSLHSSLSENLSFDSGLHFEDHIDVQDLLAHSQSSPLFDMHDLNDLTASDEIAFDVDHIFGSEHEHLFDLDAIRQFDQRHTASHDASEGMSESSAHSSQTSPGWTEEQVDKREQAESDDRLLFHSLSPLNLASTEASLGELPTELSLWERKLLRDLCSACSLLHSNQVNCYLATHCYNDVHDSPIDTSLVSQFLLHRLIRMCARMAPFTALKRCDQKAMLRRSLLEIASLRSVQLYDPQREAWRSIDDKYQVMAIVPLEMYRPFCHTYPLDRHKRFPSLFRDEWKRDEAIIDLLSAIVLFTPYPEYLERQKIDKQRQLYTRLLSRYLTTKYENVHEADKAYHQLLSNVHEMRTLHVDVRAFFSHQALRQIPLFNELHT